MNEPKTPTPTPAGSTRVCPTCKGRQKSCRECGGSGYIPVISRPCLRDASDDGEGPCSAGMCCWPDCVPTNAERSGGEEKR